MKKQFPKEFKELLKSIFLIHYNSRLTAKHIRLLKIYFDKHLANWNTESLQKDFLNESNPDAYTKLINLCDIIIRKDPAPIKRKHSEEAVRSGSLLLKRIAKLIRD